MWILVTDINTDVNKFIGTNFEELEKAKQLILIKIKFVANEKEPKNTLR